MIDKESLLRRVHSMSSCAGYHTPIEDEIIEGYGVSEIPSDNLQVQSIIKFCKIIPI